MSVVVPAHDEERTIARLLTGLVEGDPAGDLDIVVVANGCSDRTAATARAVSPRLRVLEIDVASKIAALNAGDAATDVFPRAYVDADAEVSAAALLALADDLSRPGVVLTAAPRLRLETSGGSLLSRMYHQVWTNTPYVVAGPIGCGVYVLSQAARERFAQFPSVIADDLYVERLAGEHRLVDESHQFVFHAPRSTEALLSRLTRATLGNLQLEVEYGMEPGTGGAVGLLRRMLPRPWLWPSLAVYIMLRGIAERRARRRLASGEFEWSRDHSTR